MTQALAVQQRLSRWGHEVVGVAAGRNETRSLPDFFGRAFTVPITDLESPGFVFRRGRSVNLPATLWRAFTRLPVYADSLRRLRALVDETRPDLVLNFFEPLTGLGQLLRPLPVPVIAVAHQFMIHHPAYLPSHRLYRKRFGLKLFARLVGCRSRKLALSMHPASDLPERRLTVSPPLLRDEVFGLEPVPGGYFLVYLLNHGYGETIRAWHREHPDIALHCFYDRPGAPEVETADPTLTFHRLSGEKFLRMMTGCRGIVSTAGFELVAEAAWLGKPLLLVPVEHHDEQLLNALDAARLGLGITERTFTLDRLRELPAWLDNSWFREWLGRADAVLERALDDAVPARRQREPDHSGSRSSSATARAVTAASASSPSTA